MQHRPSSFATRAIRLSIIIVSYNSRSYLEDCLHALLETIHSDTEIVLVDNGSADGSVQFVARTFPHVRLHCASENIGYAGGNNAGARLAHGKYLLFLNPDTKVARGWLDPLIQALETKPYVGMVTPKILLLNEPEKINTCGNEIHCSGLTLCRGLGKNRESLDQPSPVSAVSGAAFLIRRELFNMLGGFDQTFFMYMEDIDLSWRARLAGWSCYFVPDSIVYHDYSLQFGPRKIFYQERNRYLMLLKSVRWRTIALLLPIWLLAEFVTWGFVLRHRQASVGDKIDAYRWVWRHRSQIVAERRRVQRTRRVTDHRLFSNTTFALSYEQVGSVNLARPAHWMFDTTFAILRLIGLILLRW